jgi:hypothetical protein
MDVKLIFVGWAACIATALPVCWSQEAKFNERVRASLETVLRAIETPYTGDWKATRTARELFDDALTSLSGNVAPDLHDWAREKEDADIRAKLVVIAKDKQANSKVYAGIMEKYKVDTKFVTPRPPPLAPADAQGEFRLAWEYILLSPPSPQLDRALDALAKINDPKSVLTLLHCFRTTTREGVRSKKVAGIQGRLLKTLAAFRSKEGLGALLECIWLSKRQQDAEGQERAEFDAESEVYNMLTGKYGTRFGQRDEWKKIIAEFPKASLNREQAEFLQRVMKGD